jgi:hypothetical protein
MVRQGNVAAPLKRILGQLLQPGSWVPFNEATAPTNIDFKRGFELEEVFEPSNSPIRKLEELEIGKPALAHRLATGFELVSNRLAPTAEQSGPAQQGGGYGAGGAAGATGAGGQAGAGGAGGGQAGVPNPSTSMGGAMGVSGGAIGQPPNAGQQGGSGGQQSTGAGPTTPYGIERNRYVTSSAQVRRVPVAMVVVMDQTHRNALLTTIANSKLRIQTTQVYLRHREPVSVASSNVRPPDMGGGMGGGGPVVKPPGGGDLPKPGGGDTPKENPPKDNKPETQGEGGHNLIELTVHGVANLYERYKETTPAQPPQGQPPVR